MTYLIVVMCLKCNSLAISVPSQHRWHSKVEKAFGADSIDWDQHYFVDEYLRWYRRSHSCIEAKYTVIEFHELKDFLLFMLEHDGGKKFSTKGED